MNARPKGKHPASSTSCFLDWYPEMSWVSWSCAWKIKCGSAGKTCQAKLNIQGMVSKPAVPTAKGPELFAQLDEAFGLDRAEGGRRNALHLLRASQADAAPTATQPPPGKSS